jgi:hypothetical protein
MLKPYVCVACEKVIIDQPMGPQPLPATGPPSLINLFSKMLVETPPNIDIPANSVSPYSWAIFSAWDTEPGDETKRYFLCTAVLYPDGSYFGEVHRIPIPVVLGQRSQMVVRIYGFPIGQSGFYTVRTWIEEGGKSAYGPIEFKIELQFIVKEQQPPEPKPLTQ